MSAPVSVITIVKNRTEKLCNLINQLEACSPTPDELLIVWMTPPSDLSLITSDKFNIEHKFVNQEELPIAKARNKGMFDAKNDLLAYISVDTIFSPACLKEAVSTLVPSSIMRAPVRSIPITSRNQPYTELLHAKSEINLGKPFSVTQTSDTSYNDALPKASLLENTGPVDKQDNNHGKFSNDSSASAMFFIRKADFEKTNGFDETYDGYGLNDEDFFTQCRNVGLSLTDHPSIVFSPSRDLTRCPVNHLLDFVHNAQIFREKWGFYPRKDILCAYADKGLINKDFEHNSIRVVRLPNENELSESKTALAPIDKPKKVERKVKKPLNKVLAEPKAPFTSPADKPKSKSSALKFFRGTERKSA
ncbi:glycosyl transferase family 2 [Alteromonas genovensis]|uniref:Glycosyl transferase family 2 n=1 Tax=Alteromonas genovensis TaxID=471225 RepID=A0A6N9TJF1_9ALTE|nr:glycosyltransferase family 2 protein [Alteromonas genovensis]NDW16036.1 glycosyl transferase family 2 [Alteromonas genovensis]